MADSTSPGRIFVSYRREETAYAAHWLFDRLAEQYGAGQIFKDVDPIELGDDFVEVITAAVGSCDVLLALIGDRWLTVTDENGRRRLDDPNDLVRLEIEAALRRNVIIIPILVEGASMPRADELPASMAGLARRQALELNPGGPEDGTSRLLRILASTSTTREQYIRALATEQDTSRQQDRSRRVSAVQSTDRRLKGWYRWLAPYRRRRSFWSGRDELSLDAPAEATAGLASDSPHPLRDAIDSALKELVTEGRIAFNPPDRMRQGHVERVEVTISRSKDLDDVLRRDLRGKGDVQISPLQTSPFMVVELHGPGFQITTLNPTPGGEQLVAQTARWEFDVLPKRSGTQRLQLSVAMRIPLPDRPDERVSAPVLERDIRVTVDPYYSGQQFVAKNWQWLVGAAVGLGGAIGAWLKLFGGD
ncbi:MAG TPA: toll/interleukin-1 receptor domain-containing protein [Propionibacteriaceae bacterium]|nr:toll/interleukin-1 receptor domain-containing protein [Propionibacteriaceae bacterium]